MSKLVYTMPDKDPNRFKGIHDGETCLMVATGPSLDLVPPEFLEKYTTFSMNRITLKVPEFVPDYYLCIGLTHYDTPEKIVTMRPLVSHLKCRAAFLSRMWDFMFPWTKVITTLGATEIYGYPVGYRGFSLDPTVCLGTTTNSVYPSLQCAYWLGFKRVLIVGLDHRYPEGTKKHFYDDAEAPGFDVGPGRYTQEVWQEIGSQSFRYAREIFERGGREIINLTPGSATDAFVFDKLENW